MQSVLLALHLMVCIGLIFVVLLQRSEGGALGLGGGGAGGVISGQGAANVLQRATTILGALFFLVSLVLTISAGAHKEPGSVFEAKDAAKKDAPLGPSIPAADPKAPAPGLDPAAAPAGGPAIPAPAFGPGSPLAAPKALQAPEPKPAAAQANPKPAAAKPAPAGPAIPGGENPPQKPNESGNN